MIFTCQCIGVVSSHSLFPLFNLVKIPPIKVYSNVSIKDLSTWIFSHCCELLPWISIEVILVFCLYCFISWFVLGSYLLSHYFCHLDSCFSLNTSLAPSFPIWFSLCVCFAMLLSTSKSCTLQKLPAIYLMRVCRQVCEIRIQFRKVKFYSRYILLCFSASQTIKSFGRLYEDNPRCEKYIN